NIANIKPGWLGCILFRTGGYGNGTLTFSQGHTYTQFRGVSDILGCLQRFPRICARGSVTALGFCHRPLADSEYHHASTHAGKSHRHTIGGGRQATPVSHHSTNFPLNHAIVLSNRRIIWWVVRRHPGLGYRLPYICTCSPVDILAG